jgi:hypothetical protein
VGAAGARRRISRPEVALQAADGAHGALAFLVGDEEGGAAIRAAEEAMRRGAAEAALRLRTPAQRRRGVS